jgi:hypothetical protein
LEHLDLGRNALENFPEQLTSCTVLPTCFLVPDVFFFVLFCSLAHRPSILLTCFCVFLFAGVARIADRSKQYPNYHSWADSDHLAQRAVRWEQPDFQYSWRLLVFNQLAGASYLIYFVSIPKQS